MATTEAADNTQQTDSKDHNRKRAVREDEKEEAEFKRNERKRQEDKARRAHEAHKARSPPRWHELVMGDGSRRRVYLSSSSKLVQNFKASK
jgi:hypothetical protein